MAVAFGVLTHSLEIPTPAAPMIPTKLTPETGDFALICALDGKNLSIMKKNSSKFRLCS
jgi:hypothetical protein